MDARSPRVVFMGTPTFAVPSLLALAGMDGDVSPQVVGVFTQPDRPAGRGRRLTPPPVKEAAERLGIPVYQPERLRRPEGMEMLTSLAPDLIVVAAYAQILPQRVLDLPPLGCLNVHASLLPRYRGASPISAAILDGQAETGVSIMRMEAGLDAGPVISQARIAIKADDTTGSLTARLAELGAHELRAVLGPWVRGELAAQPQNEAEATMTRPLRKEDGWLAWHRPAQALGRQVRAMTPWPGAATMAGEERLKILEARAMPDGSGTNGEPGTLLASGGEPVVATGQGTLVLLRVQPAGRKAMSGAEWLRGAHDKLPAKLGDRHGQA